MLINLHRCNINESGSFDLQYRVPIITFPDSRKREIFVLAFGLNAIIFYGKGPHLITNKGLTVIERL